MNTSYKLGSVRSVILQFRRGGGARRGKHSFLERGEKKYSQLWRSRLVAMKCSGPLCRLGTVAFFEAGCFRSKIQKNHVSFSSYICKYPSAEKEQSISRKHTRHWHSLCEAIVERKRHSDTKQLLG